MSHRFFRLVPVAALLLAGATVMSGRRPAHAAASQPTITQACLSGAVSATFAWQGADSSAKEVWLDLSLFDNGWQDHSFMSAGPLTSAVTSFSWFGLPSKVPFYTRVSQLMPDGSWSTSGTAKFASMDCAAASTSSSSTSSSSSSSSGTTPPPITDASTLASAATATPTPSSSSSAATATPTTVATATPTATPKPVLAAFTLFNSALPKGYDDLRPTGTIGYFLPDTGADLNALKSQITVTMVGPGGNVFKSSNPSSAGWNWDTGIPGGLAIWMNPSMPMASYTVTITLPDGRTASAGFFHFVPSAG